jgi:AAA ATPase domain
MGEATVGAGASRPGTVADRLRQARRHHFVGRAGELELFRTALQAPEPPFTVLHVHGPGGVGKTALVQAFAEAAVGAGRAAVALDGRELEPSPPGFLAALGLALGVPNHDDPLAALPSDRPVVLLLDTYEVAAPLDDWLRQRFLPALPGDTLVVLSGRNPPTPAWRVDAGWRDLLRVISLRNLRPEDSRAYLHAAGVPEELHGRVLEVTHGHPLALSLVVDVLAQRGTQAAFEPTQAPDVVRLLLGRFLEAVPSGRHRQALQVGAHTRLTTEGLLRGALGPGDPDAHELFEWLRGLSFVQQGPFGLFPHELAADTLDADLRWRDREEYVELHRRVRAPIVQRILTTHGHEQQRAIFDLIYLHRGNPVARPYWEWASLGQVFADALRPADRAAMLELTHRHEGEASVALVARWLDRQPEAFSAMRDGRGELLGFLAILSLSDVAPEDVEADPGTRAAWSWAQRHGPPRPGEQVTQLRFMMEREGYQHASPGVNLASVQCLRRWFATPRLAWDFLTVADPGFWGGLFAYLDYQRAPEADFEVGGRRYATFARDWRRLPLEPWLDLMGRRELDTEFTPAAEPEQPAPLLALSQPEFEEAVRRALHDLNRPDLLARNPLIRSRLVREQAGDRPPAQVLAALLRSAAGGLAADPRDERLRRAVDRTYLRPAPTQERAAELLGLPFSTYRRHLTQGVGRVVAALWEAELYGPAPQPGQG